MKNLRRKFERFCFQNRSKGIPNLMLYVTLGSALVYLVSMLTNSTIIYDYLCFDFNLILKGQVWRLLAYAIAYDGGNLIYTAIGLLCYYSLGSAMERVWGTCRFNLYYFCGILLMDVYGMVVGAFLGEYAVLMRYYVDITWLNMSLFLGYATLYPDTHFMLFFIIPVRAWIFALMDLAMTALQVISFLTAGVPVLISIFPLVALANYFLFFGSDVKNVFPLSWRANAARLFKKKKKYAPQQPQKPIPFPGGASYQADTATVKAPYTHRCTVCGRTDVSHPDLEFRYCSRCTGYHCYCQEHISNHEHITEQ